MMRSDSGTGGGRGARDIAAPTMAARFHIRLDWDWDVGLFTHAARRRRDAGLERQQIPLCPSVFAAYNIISLLASSVLGINKEQMLQLCKRQSQEII
jgi:hypothetical protein